MAKIKKIKENLLVEQSSDFIVESSEMVTLYEGDGGKKEGFVFLKLTGVFQKGNYPNGNRRIYKTELLARENDKFQSRISQGTALGKGYHPGFFDLGGPSGLSDITHRITKTWMEGDIVRGELIVLKTSMGKNEVEPIIAGGGKIGISSRGYGSMEHHEKYEIAGKTYKNVFVVNDDYRLETYDLVLTPSVKAAMMKPMKKEDLYVENEDCNEEDILRGGNNSMTIEELKTLHPELYNKIHDAAVQEGKDIRASEVKVQVASEHVATIEIKNEEIGKLKETNKALIVENGMLKTENKDFKDKVKKVEAEKLAIDIKSAVMEAIGKSGYKAYFKNEDIEYIVSISDSVGAGAKEVKAREDVYENVIATFKAASVIDTKSKKFDTSEDNANETDTVVEKDYQGSQRSLAFG